MQENKTLDISWGTILKIAITTLLLYIIYQIKDLLIWFLFALIISVLFNPVIDFLKKLKIPRVLAVILVYVVFFGLLTLLVYAIAPMFVYEIQQFTQFVPQYFEKVSPTLRDLGLKAFENIEVFIETIKKSLDKITTNVFNALVVIFGGIFTTIFIIILSIFLSLEEKGVEKALSYFFPKKYENYALSLWRRCQRKISNWFLVRVLACLFVGAVSLVVFLLFKTPYPFTLGFIAGALNFIPVVGLLLTAILLFIMVSLDSLLKAVFVVVAYILIQVIENNILTPLLLRKFIDLSPVLILMALAIGGVLWGVLGGILAIPIAGILSEFLKDFLEKRKEREAQ